MNRKRVEENMKIDRDYVLSLIEGAKNTTDEEIERILEKAKGKKGLEHSEIAALLEIKSEEQARKLFEIAGQIKRDVYGNRVVLFARSEEHTSELQSRQYLVCRLLLEKKNH